MDPAYVRRYRDLYQRHWWWRAREEVIVGLLREHRPPGGWPHILNVGCAGGWLFDRLTEFGDAHGVELDESLVGEDPAMRRRIHIGPFDETYQPPQRFGLILMLDVIEHLNDPAAALRRAMSMLEPDGLLLVTVPAFQALWTTHDDVNEHRIRYTKTSMRTAAAAGGMRIERMKYFFYWTAPVKFAQRVVEGVARSRAKPAAVPPRPVNALLYALSRAEYAALGRWPVPFGSSLVVLGRHPKTSSPPSPGSP